MRRLISAFSLATGLLIGQTAPAVLSLPQWLAPFPGASPVASVDPALVESSYVTSAHPDDVSAHYSHLFATHGLAFQANFDGLGTVLRASAPECDLLIKIRDASSGTAVKVDCASKATPSAGPDSTVIVSNGGVNQAAPGARSRDTAPPHLKSAEEIRQYNEERSREIQAKREALEHAGNATMQQYDNPVYPASHPLITTMTRPRSSGPHGSSPSTASVLPGPRNPPAAPSLPSPANI